MSTTPSLRPARDTDREFLYQVYRSTRVEELAPVPWSEAQKDSFLRHQFALQHDHYTRHYEGAQYLVIEVDGQPAGRLYVARWPREIRLMDIALLPAFRGRGLGTQLIDELLAEGARSGRRVSIHVERENPALRLYERLGFRQSADRGVYYFLEWSPPEPGAQAAETGGQS